MKRAQLYLRSALRTAEYVDANALSDLAEQAANDSSMAEIDMRRSDMRAAVGAWTERSDLPDCLTYIANLRDGADR